MSDRCDLISINGILQRPANKDMVEGYLDGFGDKGRDDLPYSLSSNRSASYVHGWLNGRDDRRGYPRASFLEISRRADEAMRMDDEARHE
jgi:ribosome modulation factor